MACIVLREMYYPMATPKKPAAKAPVKPNAKLKDLPPKKDAKGGILNPQPDPPGRSKN
jgi:hypothetical protein